MTLCLSVVINTVRITRLHSSRMCTARVLTVSPSMLCAGGGVFSGERGLLPGVSSGGSLWGGRSPLGEGLLWGSPPRDLLQGEGRGVSSWGLLWGDLLWGVPSWVEGLLRGVSQHALRQTPPVNRMTNRCKNITLPQTSFAGGN